MINTQTPRQQDIVSRLVSVNWTEDNYDPETEEVSMIAYAFDGMINKYGWVAKDGGLTILTEDFTRFTFEEIDSILVEVAK